MERLIVLRCPTLAREGQEGEELRRFAAVLTTVVRRCPFVEPVRLGLAALPARAPSRFFGGEQAVCDLLAEDLAPLLEGEVSLGAADGLFAATLAKRSKSRTLGYALAPATMSLGWCARAVCSSSS